MNRLTGQELWLEDTLRTASTKHCARNPHKLPHYCTGRIEILVIANWRFSRRRCVSIACPAHVATSLYRSTCMQISRTGNATAR
jgi:hypothetical protein